MSWVCQRCRKRIDDIDDHMWSCWPVDGYAHPYHKACAEELLAELDAK